MFSNVFNIQTLSAMKTSRIKDKHKIVERSFAFEKFQTVSLLIAVDIALRTFKRLKKPSPLNLNL